MSAIVWPQDGAAARELGGKGAALASAQLAGLPVPDWFAVPPCAAPAELEAALAAALARLCPKGEPVAVRSSAPDEDGARLSFAGQLDSHLFVPPEAVAERIADVRRSGTAARVRAYRELHGREAQAPAVLVQRMVHAEAAGVAFSADPVSGRRATAVVAAVRGVGAALVAGEQDADSYSVERGGRVTARALVGAEPCLSDAQAAAVAALARRCEGHFGRPQDIEWALEDGKLWLLQSRPITSLAGLADPDGALAVWDSSNIAESYGGQTTPLTFSFIRRCYEHVYRELARLGGVAEEAIRAHDDDYRRMLGFVRGRVYYNLLAWYRLLALAPGFRYNRRFLDEMLGVRDEAQAEALTPPPAGWRVKAALLRQAARALVHYFTVERINRRFRARLDAVLAAHAAPLASLRIDELAAQFRALEARLLRSWDAPLINDFLAMIFHGLLRRLVARWLPAADAGLDNHLLSGESGIISVEPVRRIREMARLAAAEPELAAALRGAPRAQALERLSRSPAVYWLFLAYLEAFCERCPEELKLESLPLDEDPLPLLRAVGELAARGGALAGPQPVLRGAAEARVVRALRRRPVRRCVFAWVLRYARARVRDRENLRFERTRVFARVRRILVEVGKRLHALDVLDAPRDVFYLELEEVLGFVDGTATCSDLRALAAVRRADLARQHAAGAPPRRFATRGVGQLAHGLVPTASPALAEEGDARRGTGCCPGVVRGRARVVARAEDARLLPGEILVAERTDPGWVMLFAAAAGLVVERGSLLSHAAIVAREMALPAVVGLAGACAWLRDGDLIELDGAAGTVRRL